MGQTLSHGVYLPNEGERNCYAGLASNWQILNTAVGNIAEKAPLVHTHGNISNDGKVGTTANLPLITGTGGAITAGAFGNQANTFCEGNDSRLSDARTPVAHTHTKSDVTDLLNSNFIPSANNSYDLGSSTNQWNNLYANNYYYNGVAWGLDKSNTWTGNNTFTSTITTKTNVDRTVAPSADSTYGTIICRDKNGSAIFRMQGTIKTDLSNVWDMMMVAPNNSYLTFFRYTIDTTSAYKELRLKADSVIPDLNNGYNLGSSNYKWKTLNGINPGALSLPNLNYSDSNQWIDISGNITDETGGSNEYDPTVDGWVVIRANNSPTSLRVNVNAPRPSARKYLASRTGVATPDGMMIVNVPAPAGSRVYIYFDKGSGSLDSATFITCQGNV